jgi:hypothetical protein
VANDLEGGSAAAKKKKSKVKKILEEKPTLKMAAKS